MKKKNKFFKDFYDLVGWIIVSIIFIVLITGIIIVSVNKYGGDNNIFSNKVEKQLVQKDGFIETDINDLCLFEYEFLHCDEVDSWFFDGFLINNIFYLNEDKSLPSYNIIGTENETYYVGNLIIYFNFENERFNKYDLNINNYVNDFDVNFEYDISGYLNDNGYPRADADYVAKKFVGGDLYRIELDENKFFTTYLDNPLGDGVMGMILIKDDAGHKLNNDDILYHKRFNITDKNLEGE